MNAQEKERTDIMKEEIEHYWRGLESLRKQVPSKIWKTAYIEDVWNRLPKQGGDITIDSIPPELKKSWHVSLGVDSTWLSFRDAILAAEATINAVARTKDKIEREKANAQRAFWVLYIFGSAASILGNGLRLTHESGEATEHPEVG